MAAIVSHDGFIEVGKGYKVPKSAEEKEEEADIDQPEASLRRVEHPIQPDR